MMIRQSNCRSISQPDIPKEASMHRLISRITSRFISGLVVLLLTMVSAAAQQEPVEMAQYYIGMIYKGDKWASIPPATAREIQSGHRANIKRLEETGQMVLAGPIDEAGELRGIFIYNTETLEEAEQLVNTDPAVRAGRLRIELYPFWTVKALQNLHNTGPLE